MLRVVDVVAKTTVQQSAKMLVAEIPGDIQIGAMFPMHRQISGAEGCGAIWEQYGIQRAEIAMMTVAELNRELPFKLGISIRDSCWTERIAMEQAIAFLREGVAQCSCCQTAGCQKKSNPIIAIVGPAKSATTIAVQNLLQVFRIPQIAYSATTTDLSDKEQFSYFMRVVPSDVWQARAINNLLMHFNWTYIGVVYSGGNYGEKGFEAMERLSNSEVCIAQSRKVKTLADIEEYEEVLMSMSLLNPRPQVAVCFCEGASMRKIFEAQQNLRRKNPKLKLFQWIGSDGWADRMDVVEGVEDEASGSFSMRIHSPKVEKFEPYYFHLDPHNHTVNPWFRDFWQQKFKCMLTVPKDDTTTKQCSGKESLKVNYEQDPKLSQVINSIRVVAYALKEMYKEKCMDFANNTIKLIGPDQNSVSTSSPLCPEMETINGTQLFRYMMKVNFTDEFQQDINFNEHGDPPPWYDILNYVKTRGYVEAGYFRQKRDGQPSLRMVDSPKVFFDGSHNQPESVCSKPCTTGQRKRETTACCWICETCADVQIVNHYNNTCQNCPFGFWPSENRTACIELPKEYHPMSSLSSMIALTFASIGVLITLLTVFVFLNHNSTPVVKSTTRELSYIILSGIAACFLVSFAILAKPSFVTCFFTRVLPPVAFSIIYSALLTKTNRIARILAGSKKRILTKKPRFLSTMSQVVITWMLVGVQCVIVAVSVLEEMPQEGFDPVFVPKRMVLICSSSSFASLTPFLWNLFLITLCTVYAVKTRNLPENFNEAKFIGFTMYCTFVVWIAFFVLQLNTTNKALTMSYSFSLCAFIALILLFFPKLYIIILHPEKNVRASYTTTKLIRCHFGNSQGMSDSKHFSSKTRTSSQSISISQPLSPKRVPSTTSRSSSGPTRTASLHVVNQTTGAGAAAVAAAAGASHRHHHDAATQTEGTPSRFARTFSMRGGPTSRRKTLDDDVMLLIDSCRRYQDERLQGTNVQNMLLEENCEDEEEDDVQHVLASSIEKGMRMALSTVSRVPKANDTESPTTLAVPVKKPSKPLPSSRSNNNNDSNKESHNEKFEQLLRSRGVQPVQLSSATQL
uniref:G_PROTEIN_RECEP_F3_4 domain-containing protein n=1 Tax=Panagrellus redivivus TaxID=6233 RepID=A0A7E4WCF0_PANRE